MVVVESNMTRLLDSLVAAGIDPTAIVSLEDLEDGDLSVA
jgi:hypothetical protein